MSDENVERFKRGVEAYNRRDADALLEFMDPEVERVRWYEKRIGPPIRASEDPLFGPAASRANRRELP